MSRLPRGRERFASWVRRDGMPTPAAGARVTDEDTLGSRRPYRLTCQSAPVRVPAVSHLGLINTSVGQSFVILAVLIGA